MERQFEVRNSGDPYFLDCVDLAGVTKTAARQGEQVEVYTRLALTSDDALFHRVAENLIGVINHHMLRAESSANLVSADTILMVIRPDNSAQLWVDTAATAIQVMVRRDISAGSVVFDTDIADILAMSFPAITIGSEDKVVCLFRQDWRFALYFDFNPRKELSTDDLSRTLGTLYRTLRYRHLYDLLKNDVVFNRLVGSGWFPFVEIMPREFRRLADASQAGFDLGEEEEKLIAAFDRTRLDRLLDRWLSKPHFKHKETLLRSAVRAYLANDPIPVLKIVLTEIEGILRAAYAVEHSGSPSLFKLLRFAVESATSKAGSSNSLLFSAAFAKYLNVYTFANCDPAKEVGSAGSRHAVGHGAATAETYTMTRALQSLLTLDQLAFYT